MKNVHLLIDPRVDKPFKQFVAKIIFTRFYPMLLKMAQQKTVKMNQHETVILIPINKSNGGFNFKAII